MIISIGSDHAGYELRQMIKTHLIQLGHEVIDHGATAADIPFSYVKAGLIVAGDIAAERAEKGIVICGTGIGISIACNKKRGIRCALCLNEFMAKMARQHNNAQILALGARVVGSSLALSITDSFLIEDFEGGRHAERVNEIKQEELSS